MSHDAFDAVIAANPTHVPAFWTHRHFQDRAVHLWEVLADRYKDAIIRA
jgi:hypothetical protein